MKSVTRYMTKEKYVCSRCFYPFRANSNGHCKLCNIIFNESLGHKIPYSSKWVFSMSESSYLNQLEKSPDGQTIRFSLSALGRRRYKALCLKLGRRMKH